MLPNTLPHRTPPLGSADARRQSAHDLIHALFAAILITAPAFTTLANAQAGPPMRPAAVKVQALASGRVAEKITLTGTVIARRTATISAEANGPIAEVLYDEGASVGQSAPLVRIRSLPVELSLAEAKAILDLKREELRALQNGTRAEDLEMSRANLAAGKAALELARKEEARLKLLLEKSTISQADYDVTRAQLDRAEAEVKRLQADADKARNGARKEEVTGGRADVAAQEARVKQLEDQLDRLTIKAPFAGVAGLRMTEVGQWIRVGEPVCTLAETSALQVQVNLPDKYFAQVHPGTPAKVTIDAIGKTYEAVTSVVIGIGDVAARTFPVKVDVTDPAGQVAPGMMARVEFLPPNADEQPSLLIDKDAVITTPDGSHRIWTIGEQTTPEGQTMNIAVALPVTIGRVYGHAIEVAAAGLKPGTLVVTRGNETLFPNQPVSFDNSATGAQP